MATAKRHAVPPRPGKVQFTFDFEKFLAAVHYIASKGVPELAKYKICKLLFFSDKYHVVRFGRPIIGDRYCALQYDPIPSHSLDLLNQFIATEDFDNASEEVQKMNSVLAVDKTFLYPHFSSKKKLSPQESDALSGSDIKALDHAIEQYGGKGFYELKDVTHSDYAYVRAAEELTDLRYEDFFMGDPDAVEGALQEMLENYELRTLFPLREDI